MDTGQPSSRASRRRNRSRPRDRRRHRPQTRPARRYDGFVRSHPICARPTAQSDREAGGKTEVIPCDVRVLHQLEYAAARVDSTWGRLDISSTMPGSGPSPSPSTSSRPKNGTVFSTRICVAFTLPSAPSPR